MMWVEIISRGDMSPRCKIDMFPSSHQCNTFVLFRWNYSGLGCHLTLLPQPAWPSTSLRLRGWLKGLLASLSPRDLEVQKLTIGSFKALSPTYLICSYQSASIWPPILNITSFSWHPTYDHRETLDWSTFVKVHMQSFKWQLDCAKWPEQTDLRVWMPVFGFVQLDCVLCKDMMFANSRFSCTSQTSTHVMTKSLTLPPCG